ncbi:MAG TPA: class E sortase [Acidimicrobiales bacterium]|nr:class E sortase [Acidimicrobiales bacterium]
MILALIAGVLIVLLVAWQAALLTAAKARQPVLGVVAARPIVPFRKDPQGWVIENLRRKKWLRRSLSLGSLGAFVFAVGVIGYPFYTNLVQSRIQDRLAHQFASPELKQAYLNHKLQDGDSLTRIKIPAIGVDVVVVEGTGADSLRAGAGHYNDTSFPCEDGTVAIAGHRTTYGRPFANLDLLKVDDTITLQTPIGSCTYKVLPAPPQRKPLDDKGAAFVINPNEVQVIEAPSVARAGENPPPPAMLTLTTCHPKGSAAKRLVVQAVLMTGQTPTPATQPGA